MQWYTYSHRGNMKSLTWLHLSDWHQKGEEFDRNVVRDALLEDIKARKIISTELNEIDFIIFSGDVAFSGRAEEYQAAKDQLFDPLLKVCGLKSERLFVVPGNHDLDRSEFEMLPEELKKPFDSDAKVQKWLFDDRKKARILEPFQAFSAFVKEYTGQDKPEYACKREWCIRGKRICLLGLNSALMCGRNVDGNNNINDRGFTVIGEPQIQESLPFLSRADIKIVVLHHPLNWLTDFDCNRIEGRLKSECDFILHGHQHKFGIHVDYGIDGNCVIMPAGACYERRAVERSQFANAYSFINLNFDLRKGTAYLRRWNDETNKWIMDSRTNNGAFPFPIPGSPLISISKEEKNDNMHQLLTELREWKEIHTRTQSLLESFGTVIRFLDRSLFLDAESEWVRCSSSLNAIAFIAKDFNIVKNDIVCTCLDHKKKTPEISKQISRAENSNDSKLIQKSIIDIKQDLEAMLRVADYQIVRLVDKLMLRQ